MRGNSGFLRWAIIGFLLVLPVTGGPSRPRRMIRETLSADGEESPPITFNAAENTEMCTQNGKEVLRSSVTCEKKNGCREIETNGECCPKFLCECKVNGTVYQNGDKIVNPENPCEVCVCRGGDINCSALKCYSRNDCKNITYTPGVCCPEYMNCPPLENVELNSSTTATASESNKNDNSPSTTQMTFNEVTGPSAFLPTETSPQPNDNPTGIKIKEITKPEEIRITDDKPKNFKPIKSSEIEKPSAPSTETSIEPEQEGGLEILPEEISKFQSVIEPEIEQYTTFTFDGSADQPIQLEGTDLNTIGDESMGPKMIRQTAVGVSNEIHTTVAPFSSENEIRDDVLTNKSIHVTVAPDETNSLIHNTSVLQVGDSVVIFDRSGQTQSIPLRVVGLQRGEDTYDEDDDKKEGRIESSTDGYAESVSIRRVKATSTTEVFEVQYFEPQGTDFSSSEINTQSDEMYVNDLRKYSNSRESPVNSGEFLNTEITSSEKALDIEDSSGFSPIGSFTDKVTADSITYGTIINITDEEGSSPTFDETYTNSFDLLSKTSPIFASSTSEPTIDDDETVQHDQNINFPHITDDLSIHSRMEEDDKQRVNSRVANDETEKSEIGVRTPIPTVESYILKNKFYTDIQGKSPGEPLLIPEWERNYTTIAPLEFPSAHSSETSGNRLLEDLSSHATVVDDDSTTHQIGSSNTDFIDKSLETSSQDPNYDTESFENDHTSGPSEVRETNIFNLVFDATANLLKMHNKI